MLIFAADETAPRLRYILTQLLGKRLGQVFKITDNPDYFTKSKSARINYSNEIIEGVLNIPASNLLFETHINKITPTCTKQINWHTLLFERKPSSLPDFKADTIVLPFDLFAASFYLLSRYEEYLPQTRDEHNRFKAANSVAHKNNFLTVPLVDLWLNQFKSELNKLYPLMQFTENKFTQINTVDIDFAYKYKGLEPINRFKKFIGSILRKKPDTQALLPPKNDPYDQYEYLVKTAAQNHVPTKFFLLLANYGGFDKNLDPKQEPAASLYKTLAENFPCGIHPSYRAAIDSKAFAKEVAIYENLLGYKPQISRFHFLKLNFPDSLRMLNKMGITEDYTLMYSEQPGFRASTCFPFEAYDLGKETVLPITLHSPCIMDASLNHYMKLPVEDAIEKIKELKLIVRNFQGEFISIWHNSSFDSNEGWANWEKVYEALFE